MTTTPWEGGADLLVDMPKKVSPFIELGATGVKRTAGYLDEEFLPQLRGRKAVKIYREMSDNDPVVGALLFAVDRLLRNVEWRVEENGAGAKAAEFLESCMEDMSHTWDDFISECLSMLPYGWSWHEIVYKRRVGPWEDNPAKRSKYNDGKIGWRKLPIRSQETLHRWIFDDSGGVKGMVQMAPPAYQQVVLPIDKSLLFRLGVHKGNPEGRSFLRNAYRPWYLKKRLEEIEGIGVERDLAGLPMAKIPKDYLTAPKGSDKAKMAEAFRKMVRGVRRDEQEGLILPNEFDQDTKQPLFSFELLSSGGGRAFDTDRLIRRYEERILMSVLADFILVGHQSVGSYALHTDKTGLFRSSINSIADSIADVLNRYAIPRLFAVNGWKQDKLPEIRPGDVDPPDLTQLSSFMNAMSSAGVQWFPDPELEKFLRSAARLPEMDENAERVREAEYRQAQVIRVAQQRMEMLQMADTADQTVYGNQQAQMQHEQAGMQHQQVRSDPQAAFGPEQPQPAPKKEKSQ